jgi:methanogenic corrinoid protein MtbC1
MTQDAALHTLSGEGLQRFQTLQTEAVSTVTDRFYASHGSIYSRFGPRGRDACREDLAFHLEFLRPVLEFGLLQPMTDYLGWLGSVLAARAIPVAHLKLSLEWLAEFFAEHMEPSDGNLVATGLRAASTSFLNAKEGPPKQPDPSELWPEAATFEMALLAGSQRDALAVVTGCIDTGHSLADVELHVIQPSLYHIGDKWQANQVTVAQEHLATAITEAVMTLGLLRSSPLAAIGKRVLLACVEGNNHTIGLRTVSDAFQLAGWDVQYLGASVPTRALVSQAVTWKPDLIGLSVSFPQQLRAAKNVIVQLRDCLGNTRPAVIIGGLAINRFNRLANMVGADSWSADAAAAVVYANQRSAA